MILFNSVGKQFVLEAGTRSNTGPQVQHGRRRRLFYDKKRRFPESDLRRVSKKSCRGKLPLSSKWNSPTVTILWVALVTRTVSVIVN